MSKWNKPMRAWTPEPVFCRVCLRRIIADGTGWSHQPKIRIKDPNYHVARP